MAIKRSRATPKLLPAAAMLADGRDAFLRDVEDRLRSLSDPLDIMACATERLGIFLRAGRCGYAEIDPTGTFITIASDWTDGTMPSAVGRYNLKNFGAAILANYSAGRSAKTVDILADPTVDGDTPSAYVARDPIRGRLGVPLLKHGRLAVILFVHDSAPRQWTDDEEAFVRTLADRAWVAIERARAEASLRDTQDELRYALELNPQVPWTADPRGNIIGFSERFLDLTGLSREAVMADGWAEVQHPDDRRSAAASWAHAIATGEPHDIELRIRLASGTYRWMRSRAQPRRGPDGAIVRWYGVKEDIDDRKQAETKLRDLNANLEAQVDARTAERDAVWRTSEDLFVVHTIDGGHRTVNPGGAAALGYAVEELNAMGFAALSHPDDQARVTAAFVHVAAGGAIRDFDLRLRDKDGTYRPYSWSATAGAGEGVVYSTCRDITQRMAREAELQVIEEQLRQAQKMEAVGQLTGGLAHDFNNMLQATSLGLDLARQRIDQGRGADARPFIDAASRGVDRAAALTHRLLAFARRQPLDARPMMADGLINGMVELIQRTAGPSITLQTRLSAGTWPVLCDANQVENALLNLAINARDAMPNGGMLTLATAEITLSAADLANDQGAVPGDYVAISVTDTGEGMTADVLRHAFEPFFTTKPQGQGTGLGLSQTHGFVYQSGGLMRLESQLGMGTTVRILLPRVHLPVLATDPLEPVSNARAGGQVILLVEDVDVVRTLTAEILREQGYVVLEAADGPAAVRLLVDHPRIDALVTDVGLPGMNGRQLADAVRETFPDLPVLFVTGYAGMALRDPLPPNTELIGKPFNLDVFLAVVRRMVGMSGV